MNSQDKSWELTRLKESKKKASSGEIILGVLLTIGTGGLWLLVWLPFMAIRSMTNQSIDKKIKHLLNS